MNPKIRKGIIGAAFILALIYGLGNIWNSGAPRPEVGKDTRPAAVKATVVASLPADLEPYRQAPWGKDPFMRAERLVTPSAAEVSPAHVLEGILFDDHNPAAVINGQVVRGGDTVDGARVVQIEKGKVTLNRDGSPVVLTLKKDRI